MPKLRVVHHNVSILSFLMIAVALLLTTATFKNYQNNRIRIAPQSSIQPESKPGRIILLVLDTLRAESMSLYGGRAPTDNLYNFAKDAVVFENCIAPSPWTVPSHASLFTGLHPIEHRCHGNLDNTRRDIFNFPEPNPLNDKTLTLAEIFKNKGFATVGISANSLVFRPSLNIGKGFQIQDDALGTGHIYQNFSFRSPLHFICALTGFWPQGVLYYRTADMITTQALKSLEMAKDQSIFLFVNYMDPHEPYYPPRQFSRKFVNARFPQLKKLALSLRRCIDRISQKNWDAYMLSQYEAEIVWLDSQLGLFFDRLKKMDIYDDSLIIVTSDHGELLGEHDCYGHKTPMYDQVLRVPLLIKYPFNRHTGRVKIRTSLMDVFPTVLETFDLPIPENISGRSLLSEEHDDQPIVSVFFDFHFGKHLSIYDSYYKYMHFQHQRPDELYNLRNDPGEQLNIIDLSIDEHSQISGTLKRWLQEHPPLFDILNVDVEMSRRYLEELRSLGYLQ